MIRTFNFIRSVLLRKNRQLKAAREMVKAQESMNVILSAYIAILADRHGAVTIPKSLVSEALGKYRVSAHSDGENYVIEVERNGDRDVKKQL